MHSFYDIVVGMYRKGAMRPKEAVSFVDYWATDYEKKFGEKVDWRERFKKELADDGHTLGV